MNNPFEVIEARLNNIETLLLDIKHSPKEPNEQSTATTGWFDLTELCHYLPDKPEKSAAYGWISSNSLPKRQSNASQNTSQLQTIFQYLSSVSATASMVSDATGVPQKNLCRYKRDLEKAGRLWEVEKKPCKKTGFKAWYLTTNPANAPKSYSTQLTLF